ncbi:MAG: hypothetical protein Q9201_004366 [Fulgogasparrea decipioides]
MAPIVKQFGWRTAERAVKSPSSTSTSSPSTSRSASPASSNLTVHDRIAARRQRVIDNFAPKVAAAARKLPEPCDCCRHGGKPKKRVKLGGRRKPMVTAIHEERRYPKGTSSRRA